MPKQSMGGTAHALFLNTTGFEPGGRNAMRLLLRRTLVRHRYRQLHITHPGDIAGYPFLVEHGLSCPPQALNKLILGEGVWS